MAEKGGMGTLLVRALNGVGILAVLAAVAWGSVQWASLDKLRGDISQQCEEAEARRVEQKTTDEDQWSTIRMMNDALIEIRASTKNTDEQIKEIKTILRERRP